MEREPVRRWHASEALVRLVLNGDKIAAEERLLTDRHARVREIRQGPGGEIYLLSGNELLRLTPK